jgi:hypothetical protein
MRATGSPDAVSGPGEAAACVAAAALRTIEAGSARVSRRRFADPPPEPARAFGTAEAGVTDFAHRRTATETPALAPGIELLAERMAARFPRLGEALVDGVDTDLRAVYAGSAALIGHDDRWIAIARGDTSAGRGHTDPVWVVDALAHTDVADLHGEDELVRTQPCRRYGFAVDLGRHTATVQIPPHPGRRPPHITGEAWIDADGRIRRVTWRQAPLLRRRDPRRSRGGRTFWESTELWDYGVAAEIEVPTADVLAPSSSSLWEAWRTWRCPV